MHRLLRVLSIGSVGLVALTAIALPSPTEAQTPVAGFRPLASLNVPGAVAEIARATPDGQTLFYTDAGARQIGIVNLANPSNPVVLGTIEVDGEPTSIDVTPDGQFAVAAVAKNRPSEGEAPPDITQNSALVVIDVDTRTTVGEVPIGYHPDSVKVVVVGAVTKVVIAIENEPLVIENGLVTGDDAPGDANDVSAAGFVQVVNLNTTNPAASTVETVVFPQATLTAAGLFFPADPQPEFIDAFGTTVAVSLQENNGIGIINLSTTPASLVRVFSTGTVANRLADLTDNDTISFTETYPADVAEKPFAGARFPDAIAFSADGAVLYSADEGEMNFTGGRGWSAWTPTGTFLWDDGGSLEQEAVENGFYPDGRSDAKGIEVEGVATATFSGTPFAFVSSERGSFLSIYNITDPTEPEFVQLLATGISPEGLVPIPSRGLMVTADEVTGTLTIFEATSSAVTGTPDRPRLASTGGYAWAAISGLAAATDGLMYGIPDNAAPTEIYRIALAGASATVSRHVPVTRAGAVMRYDGEGIAIDTSIVAPATPGFWFASEGNAAFGADNYRANLLVQVDATGAVLREIGLPASVDSPDGGMISSNGFEGMTISSDGRFLVAAIQRRYAGEDETYTRVGRLDLESLSCSGLVCSGDWDFFYYPLESPSEGGWVALSEIISIGPDDYAVIERDNHISRAARIKRVYAFTLDGLNDGGIIAKSLWVDALDAFAPFEKIEGLAYTPSGDLWVGLDNDGGELESRMVNFGAVPVPVLQPGQNMVSPAATGSGPLPASNSMLPAAVLAGLAAAAILLGRRSITQR